MEAPPAPLVSEAATAPVAGPASTNAAHPAYLWAPIKKEFLIPRNSTASNAEEKKRKRDEPLSSLSEATDGAQKKEEQEGEQDEKKEKEEAPAAKSKRQKRKERKQRVGLCHVILEGGECQYGDKCKYSHDTSAFLKTKPADLGPTCALFERYGKCPLGIQCRFGGQHIKDGKNITRDPVLPRNSPRNHLSKDLRQKLWKNTRPLPRSEPVIAEWRQAQQQREQSNKGGAKTEAADAALAAESAIELKAHPREVKPLDVKGKLILAPLTTIGNLPYRVICKKLGADITVGEMAMATNILTGHKGEWALLKRDPIEDVFGVQLAGAHVDSMTRCAELLNDEISFDFLDINCGCPIDLVYNKGMGSALLERVSRLEAVARSVHSVLDKPMTIKIRVGKDEKAPTVHKNLVPYVHLWGASALTIHGRSREQRYTKEANWNYVADCAKLAHVPVIGNGDIYSWPEAEQRVQQSGVSALMLARGAIIKPWLFTEIKERRDWDITATERLDLIKQFCHLGLDHWGSDDKGVDNTRSFLLNWMSFLHRYIPVGILETLPSRLNHRPPSFFCRNELETLLASPDVSDWIKISEMFLGRVPAGYSFTPKHKSPAYKDGGEEPGRGNDVEG